MIIYKFLTIFDKTREFFFIIKINKFKNKNLDKYLLLVTKKLIKYQTL